MTVLSQEWDWIKSRDPVWETPAQECYYYVWRWKELGLHRFLDLGCGLGRHALQFAQAGYEVTAFDLSQSGLDALAATAADRELPVELVRGDMQALPFADNAFECLLSYHCIYHTDLKGLKRAVREIARVTRPGGEVFLTLNSTLSPNYTKAGPEYRRLDVRTLQYVKDGEVGTPHCYVNAHEAAELFSGFEMLQFRHVEDHSFLGKKGCHFHIHARVL